MDINPLIESTAELELQVERLNAYVEAKDEISPEEAAAYRRLLGAVEQQLSLASAFVGAAKAIESLQTTSDLRSDAEDVP